MGFRKHSVSGIREYERCPKQYWFKRVKRIKVDTTVPRHWRMGSVKHAGLEAAFLARKADEATTPDSMLAYLDEATAAVDKAWAKYDLGELAGSDWHETHRQVQVSLENVRVPKREDILGVEIRLDRNTPDGSPIIGFVDLALRVAADTLLCRDWKSGSTMLRKDVLGADFQLNTYGWHLREIYPWAERILVSHFHTPHATENFVELTDESMRDSLARFEAVVEMIEADDEYVVNPGAACSDCPFKVQCPAWDDDGKMRVDANDAERELAGF